MKYWFYWFLVGAVIMFCVFLKELHRRGWKNIKKEFLLSVDPENKLSRLRKFVLSTTLVILMIFLAPIALTFSLFSEEEIAPD